MALKGRLRHRFCQLIRAMARRQKHKTIFDALSDDELLEFLKLVDRKLLEKMFKYYVAVVEKKMVEGVSLRMIYKWRRGANPLNRYKIPFLNEYFIYSIYSILGDGHVTFRYNKAVIELATISLEFASNVATSLRKALGHAEAYTPFFITNKGHWRVCIVNLFINKLVELTKRGRIEFLLKITKGFEGVAMKALVDAEGHIHAYRRSLEYSDRNIITISNTNKHIKRLIEILLKRLKIKYTHSHSGITIVSESYKRFAKYCGTTISWKAKELQRIVDFHKTVIVQRKCPKCQKIRKFYSWVQERPQKMRHFRCMECFTQWAERIR